MYSPQVVHALMYWFNALLNDSMLATLAKRSLTDHLLSPTIVAAKYYDLKVPIERFHHQNEVWHC